ncbi:protein ABHD11 [Drosophila guanche]|uniref:sn-1-specific diacylglycerol lipase ABHD11 n=1 Tax=Drosophila guanche TaxID=7266 RepID=A0A3B0J8A1_DROGU|nr:protein ABHD11 [Drosophila guanche]SPP78387.1 blast:Alpha/beta hydrolase domain-containing protein 11 [Drosophila guanche]
MVLLLSKTLRFLQICRLNGKCPATSRAPPLWGATQRLYASSPIDMSFELFEGQTSDPSQAPLITMHGLFGSKQNWRGISKALVQRTNRKIYTVDARNHGESPHTSSHNSPDMSGDVRRFLETRAHPRACLMGHSMGGRTMMYFAHKYPEMTERLIVVDISPIRVPRTTGEMQRIFDAMVNISLPPELPLSEGRKLAKQQLLAATDSNETVEFIMLNLRKDPQTGAFSWACNAQLLREFLPRFHDYRSHFASLPPYKGPTTFICGTRSPYMKREDWPQILEMFPNAEIHWLDAHHLVHFDQPQQFISIVSEFLNRPLSAS